MAVPVPAAAVSHGFDDSDMESDYDSDDAGYESFDEQAFEENSRNIEAYRLNL